MRVPQSGKIEKQKFGCLGCDYGQLTLASDGGAIALTQHSTIQTKAAARYLEPGITTLVELMGDCLSRIHERRIDARVLMNRNRTVATVI